MPTDPKRSAPDNNAALNSGNAGNAGEKKDGRNTGTDRKRNSRRAGGKTGRQAPGKERVLELQPTVVVLATYLLLLLSKIIDVTLLNRDNEYLSVVILQMMIFLLPAAAWTQFSGNKYVRRLRLGIVRPESFGLIIASAFLMISGGLILSLLFGGLDSLSQNFSLYDTFISKDDGTVPIKLYLILAYAVLPAICEEFVYRAILCHEYESNGVIHAVIISSVFFGLLHFDIRNLPVYIFCGVILALTMYAARTVVAAMIAHFLYNIFGLFGQPYMSTLYNITGSSRLFVFVLGFVFLASAAVFCAEASRLYRNYLRRAYPAEYRGTAKHTGEEIRNLYLGIVKKPSAIACFAVYIIAIVISLIKG